MPSNLEQPHTIQVTDPRTRRRLVRALAAALFIATMLITGDPAAAHAGAPLAPTPGVRYQIVARHSGDCLTAFYPPASQVQTSACGNWYDQTWILDRVAPGNAYVYVRAIGHEPDTCLDVENAGIGNWAHVNHQPCGYTGFNRQWRLVPTDGEYVEIIARHSGRCLDISWGWAIQYDCNNGYNQQFRFRPVNAKSSPVRAAESD